MSQFTPGGTRPGRADSRYEAWPLFAFPAFGCALAVVSAFTVFAVASLAGVVALGDSASPGQPAYDYVNTHFPGSVLGFLTGHPLAVAACCVLVLAATGLAAIRRWVPAVLLLVAAAVPPWVPGLAFILQLWSLPVS
jgi:hypothetical protein